jgi:Tfp pilus assembly protein PilX
MQHTGLVDLQQRRAERGIALILALIFTVIVLGIVVSGAVALKSHMTKTKTTFVAHGQAVQFARSGLIEALGWLRKQTSQPVTAFAPVLDQAATPQVLDTIDPAIGLVREFRIAGPVWGRYEVWKDWAADPDPTRLVWRNKMCCRDISASIGGLSPGSVWQVRCIGYVFQRNDGAVPFDTLPNHVISQEVLEVEVRRLSLEPPGQAGLCTANGGSCRVRTKGRIQGGAVGGGIYYQQGTGAPSVSGSGASVTGVPAMASSASYPGSIADVFGVPIEELRAMATSVVSNANDFPDPVPNNALVICDAPITFTSSKPLRGTGAVVFSSTVAIDPGSYSSFSGLIYVDGDFTLREPAELQGSVVVTGAVTIQGNADFATIIYDDGSLNSLRQNLGTYRLSGAVTQPLSQSR